MRAAVLVRARLIARQTADSRIAIGIGGADRISRSRVSLSTGGAFTASGRALDGLGRARLTIVTDEGMRGVIGGLADWLPAIGGAVDAFVSGWTARQAEFAAEAMRLPAPTHDAIGEKLGVSRQTITRGLDAARWRFVEQLLDRFEATSWDAG